MKLDKAWQPVTWHRRTRLGIGTQTTTSCFSLPSRSDCKWGFELSNKWDYTHPPAIRQGKERKVGAWRWVGGDKYITPVGPKLHIEGCVRVCTWHSSNQCSAITFNQIFKCFYKHKTESALEEAMLTFSSYQMCMWTDVPTVPIFFFLHVCC